MRALLHRLVRGLGPAGVVGIGVLVACAGFYASGVLPAQRELAEQRLALERLRTRTPYRPVSTGGPEEDLLRFYRLFPPASALTDEVERLHRLARRAGLELAQGEYRLEAPAAGLRPYRITLPVRGTYPQVRDFAAAVLRDVPIASLDAVRFERKRAADTELDAQLRITIYVRPAGATP